MPGKISDYRLDSYIGRGRQADVYRAHDERVGRTVAVKILAAALADDTAFRERFLHETEATGEVGHPNINPVYEVGDMGGLLYVAMQFVPGGNAGSLVGRSGALPVDQASGIVTQVASALDAAHGHGLIHRDVKPANVLVDASQPAPGRNGSGAGSHVYLSDFGMGSPSVRPGPSPAGMPDFDYVAPEQIAGREADGRADLYSLACVGFYLLCGAAPYGQEQGMAAMRAHLNARPPTATALRPDLPASVDIVLATALAKNPADRYPTCAEFAAALQVALGLGVSGPGGAPLLPSHGAAGPPSDIWPAYGAAGVAVADGHGAGPKPTQVLGPVLVGPEGPGAPAAGPAGPSGAPGGPFPRADDSFPEPPGLYREPAGRSPGPGGPFPRADDSFPEPPGLYREPRQPDQGTEDFPPALGLFREPGSGYPPAPDPYTLPRGPRRPPSGRYPRRAGRGRQFVVGSAVALVVAVVVVVAVIVLSRRSGTPQAGPPASPNASAASSANAANAPAQAAAVNNLLTASASTRTSLAAAVGQVRKCTNVPAAVTQLQNVVNQRNTEVRQATALSTAAITNGGTVKSDLVAALRSSLAADSDYLTWAQQESPACKPGVNTPAYNTAVAADSRAVAAKQTFVAVWNPVAMTYNLPAQTTNTF